MANDNAKECGCVEERCPTCRGTTCETCEFTGVALNHDDCRYPALDALVRQLVDALVEAHESLHSEQCCGHERETCYEYTLRCSIQYDPALAAAAKLGYTPTGERTKGGRDE